ncbi:aspartyl-phosphate phosphatase Spo0E family protein [Clostridium sp. KNHs214]|uniref:aspartyl-phosphate phosphatase Spo0E family protein n=1 Tax=Clostridium sp. KNHs214 TaxID=1540257 RepID=UPI00054D589F|nr:aspartyl-phosphate phosphatase Spo0E family protein [Clostridium sp. KNHs214]
MFLNSTNDMQCIRQNIESTRLKLYELLEDPLKNPIDADVIELSQTLDELIVIYLKKSSNNRGDNKVLCR